MTTFPSPARQLVLEMAKAARAQPGRTIAFQGAPGANSHFAALESRPDYIPLPCFSFEDAIEAVVDGTAATAILPIENSLHGRVTDMHSLLPASKLSIVGEYFMPIRYALVGLTPGATPRDAVSHPQALGQCRAWLRRHGLNPVPYIDTAGAAALVAERGDPHIAAVAPLPSAILYGLHVLAEGIEDSPDNTTRFLIVARESAICSPDLPVVTTFIFATNNIPAALYKALGGFATNNVNMTKLESYQPLASFTATQFYVDVEGHPDDPSVRRALEELAFHSEWVRMLGTYPRAQVKIRKGDDAVA